ncbi:hypothetical protein NA57DRAFT_81397 [Rhizodiscina lignyota]|uniref:DUF7357 domain-containing protein n=1 Tax=Rhizodiscina lignyota TaxID=1504668 RepID=A0A9P4I6S0_9PEZI|nr:hypothetical protein NA57DRAFT_81397 [Rhizodiscina lignyota]
MRIRVTVHRHGLAKVKLLFPIPEDERHDVATISQLLKKINETIPLESENWGLEDYVVLVGEFECQHFAKIEEVLNHDDAVRIRPLTTTEVRARTRSGRHQVNSSGVHLIDGVPYGRAYQNRIDRPAVNIPTANQGVRTLEAPRGAQELAEDEVIGDLGQLLTSRAHRDTELDEDDDDENDDEDFSLDMDDDEDEDEEDSEADEDFDVDMNTEENDLGKLQSAPSESSDTSEKKRKKTIRFNKIVDVGPHEQQRLTGSSDEDDESDSDEESSSSDESSSEEDSSSEVSSEPSVESSNDQRSKKQKLEHGQKFVKSSNLSKRNASDTPPLSTSEEMDAGEQPKKATKPLVPWREGSSTTQGRNRRRRYLNQIKSLQAIGHLPPGATKMDLDNYLSERASGNFQRRFLHDERDENVNEALSDADLHGREAADQLMKDAFASAASNRAGEPEATIASVEPNEAEEPDTTRTEGNGDSELVDKPTDNDSVDAILAAVENELLAGVAAVTNKRPKSPDSSPKQPEKRARLDVAASQRIVFGSLGMKAPKTKEEEEKVRAKLARIGQGDSATSTTLDHEDADMIGYSQDEWKAKPPFPFHQSWDKKQKKQKKHGRKYYGQHLPSEGVFYNGGANTNEDYYEEDYEDDDENYDENHDENHDKGDHEEAPKKGPVRLIFDESGEPVRTEEIAPTGIFAVDHTRRQRLGKKKTYGGSTTSDGRFIWNPNLTPVSNSCADVFPEFNYDDNQTSNGSGPTENGKFIKNSNRVPVSNSRADLFRQLNDKEGDEPPPKDMEGFPALPSDPSSMPALQPADCKEGMYIIFTQLECNADTKWEPTISPLRCARIDRVDEGESSVHLLLKLSPECRRDPEARKKYEERQNWSGRSPYDKFGTTDDDEDEELENAGVKVVEFGELTNVRILGAVEEAAAEAAGAEQ